MDKHPDDVLQEELARLEALVNDHLTHQYMPSLPAWNTKSELIHSYRTSHNQTTTAAMGVKESLPVRTSRS